MHRKHNIIFRRGEDLEWPTIDKMTQKAKRDTRGPAPLFECDRGRGRPKQFHSIPHTPFRGCGWNGIRLGQSAAIGILTIVMGLYDQKSPLQSRWCAPCQYRPAPGVAFKEPTPPGVGQGCLYLRIQPIYVILLWVHSKSFPRRNDIRLALDPLPFDVIQYPRFRLTEVTPRPKMNNRGIINTRFARPYGSMRPRIGVTP